MLLIFRGSESEALSLRRVVCGPSYLSTFAPGDTGGEWLLSAITYVAQARLELAGAGVRRPVPTVAEAHGPCSPSPHFTHLKWSPGTFPAASSGLES